MPDLPKICGSISLPRDSDGAERRNDDFFQVRRLRIRQQADRFLTDDISLLRLRQELTKLIETHTGKLSEVPARGRARSAIYEELLQGLTVCLIRLPHRITV